MIEVIPFNPAHLEVIKPAGVHDDDGLLVQKYMNGEVAMSHCYTIIDRTYGQVLGVMNAIHFQQNVMEVCMIVGSTAVWRPIGFFKACKRELERHIEMLGVTRVQSTIRSGHPHLVKWMRLLGFEYEGTLKGFGLNGDDYMIYARVKK